MSAISFARPYLLAGLVLVPIAYALWCAGSLRSYRHARAFSRVDTGRPRFVVAGLVAFAAFLAVIAAAQPRWGTELSAIPRRSAEVIFVVDISRSMDAQDVSPSRLEATKKALTTTIQGLRGDRFGLVIFGGSARLRFPLTTDRNAATQVVNDLQTGTVLVDAGTDIKSGVDVALQAFDNGPSGGKLIVFISDGEDLGTDPSADAQHIKAAGIDFMVAGAGTTQGATIPVYDPTKRATTPKLGADGQPIVSKMDETFLKSLAVAAGGSYIGSDLSALPGAVEGRVASLQQETVNDQPTDVPIERFQWFAAAALALLVLASVAEQLPRLPVRTWLGLAGAAIVSVVLTGCATQAHDLNARGLAAYQRGDFNTAIKDFTAARGAQGDVPTLSLNLAAALNKAGRYEEAVTAAQQAITSPDPKIRARGYASVGHQQFASGDLPDALDSFRSALLENPQDTNSRHDYEVVQKLMQAQSPAQGQQQQQQPGSQNQSPQGQDQQQQGQQGQGQQPGQQGPQQNQPGQDQSGQTPGTSGTPGNQGGPSSGGQTPTPDQLSRQIAQLDQEAQNILQQSGDNLTPDQAAQLLQILAERNRLAAQRDATLGGGGNPNDY